MIKELKILPTHDSKPNYVNNAINGIVPEFREGYNPN